MATIPLLCWQVFASPLYDHAIEKRVKNQTWFLIGISEVVIESVSSVCLICPGTRHVGQGAEYARFDHSMWVGLCEVILPV